MAKFLLVFLGCLAVGLATKVSYEGYKVYKLTPKDAVALQELQQLDSFATEMSRYQFWSSPTKVGAEATLMVAPELQASFNANFAKLNVDSRVMMENVQTAIDNENPITRNSDDGIVDWTYYNTLDEINAWLQEITNEFPDYLEILIPGKSHEGRDIVGVRLDFSPGVEKEVVFMESNIHAREWITSATATYILNEFLRSDDPDVRYYAEKYTWYFFPVMNPDGFAYSHEVNRMWRKTRTRYNIFCYGADPNRNWAYQWMNGGASQNPCSDIYAGPEPFSEPSVRVMKDFIANITDNMVAYLDFHSFSQMLLLPFGHTEEHLANYDEMMQVAEVAMRDLEAVHGTEYVFGNIAETIYIAAGSSMDWVKGEFNVPIAFTYELRDRGGFGFLLPAEQIIPTAEETLVSVVSIFREYERQLAGPDADDEEVDPDADDDNNEIGPDADDNEVADK